MAGKTEYKRAWNEEKLDRIYLTVSKGHKEKIKAHIEKKYPGMSLNAYINELIDKDMETPVD